MLRRLEAHLVCRAADRALFSTGSNIPINTAMIPITTSSSTSVDPLRPFLPMTGLLLSCGLFRKRLMKGTARALSSFARQQ